MSARTRSVFKEKIGPRIARSKSVKRVRFLVVAPILAGDTKEAMRKRLKAAIEYHEPCPVKVSIITDAERIVSSDAQMIRDWGRHQRKETQ